MEISDRAKRKLARRIACEKDALEHRYWKTNKDYIQNLKLHSTPINKDAKKEKFSRKK